MIFLLCKAFTIYQIRTDMNALNISAVIAEIWDGCRKLPSDLLVIVNDSPSLPPADGLWTDQTQLRLRKTSKPIPTIRHQHFNSRACKNEFNKYLASITEQHAGASQGFGDLWLYSTNRIDMTALLWFKWEFDVKRFGCTWLWSQLIAINKRMKFIKHKLG